MAELTGSPQFAPEDDGCGQISGGSAGTSLVLVFLAVGVLHGLPRLRAWWRHLAPPLFTEEEVRDALVRAGIRDNERFAVLCALRGGFLGSGRQQPKSGWITE